jgi:hypothetical protein
MTLAELARAALFGFLGLLIGIAQFASLRANVRLYLGGHSRAAAVGLHLLRLLLVTLAWILVVRLGGPTGTVAALVGFLVARPLCTRARKDPP